MILTFGHAQMIQHAEEIFKDFLNPETSKKFVTSFLGRDRDQTHLHNNRREQVKVWNYMIQAYFLSRMPDKAIELLERMLASTSGDRFEPDAIPAVTPSTFKMVLVGFIDAGDISRALDWFERLLAQKQSVSGPFESLGGAPMRPDMPLWHEILRGLAKNNKIDDLNRLYRMMRSLADQDHLDWRPIDQLNVYSANISNLKHLSDEAAVKILNFISEDIATPSSKLPIPENLRLICTLATGFIQRGQFRTAAELTKKWYEMVFEINSSSSCQQLQEMQSDLNRITTKLTAIAKFRMKGDFDFHTASIIVKLHTLLGLNITYNFGPWYLHTYGLALIKGGIDYSKMTTHDWNVILDCAIEMESAALAGKRDLTVVPQYAFKGVASLLEDLARQGLTFSDLDKELGKRTIELLRSQLGDTGCQDLFSRLHPSYLEGFNHLYKTTYPVLENALTRRIMLPTPETPIPETELRLTINSKLAEQIEGIIKQKSPLSGQERMDQAYRLLKQNLEKGQAIDPFVLSFLISLCGRNNAVGRVHELYAIGQSILHNFLPDRRVAGWASIESSMIVALGHSDNIEAARVHRLRLLDQNLVPSADAYGILIQHVKDTTDDTSGALALFQEAVEGGVIPNLFLYNNIISKLSKARKADFALEIFRQMKVNGCKPSCVTYSAIIGACARVGDVQLAESLFSEMMVHFRPRVPAFNTMMQLFTTTKPNRTSSLYYYNMLLDAGVEPSAYTYKVHRFAILFLSRY
jgi:pentatricopeptide repeat protein